MRVIKSIFLAAVSAVLIFSLFACACFNTDPREPEELLRGDTGEFVLVVKSVELGKDKNGRDVVNIVYEFTNNSNNISSFSVEFWPFASQGGTGLAVANPVENTADDTSGQFVKINPGSTLIITDSYLLVDRSPVLLVIRRSFTNPGDNFLSRTYPLE